MFDYDLWANQTWIPYCSEDPAKGIMDHILRANLIWLERCTGESHFQAEDPVQLSEDINLAWKEHLILVDLDEVLAYKTSSGIAFNTARQDILRHVLNHGTFHRGQIRAVVEQAGVNSFPDTDYILYLRDHGL